MTVRFIIIMSYNIAANQLLLTKEREIRTAFTTARAAASVRTLVVCGQVGKDEDSRTKYNVR